MQATQVDHVEIKKIATQETTKAQEIVAIVRRAEIKTKDDYEFAANALRECASSRDEIEAMRDRWIDPLNAVVKDIRATFKPSIDAYAECEKLFKDKIGAYVVECERDRSALLTAAQAAYADGDDEQGAQLTAAVQETEVPKIAGLSTTVKWRGELTSLDALIDAVIAGKVGREMLSANEAVLQALTEARQGDPQIPGWRAEPVAAVRTARK